MEKKLLAKGQITITALSDAYHISQSIGEYIFPATSSGTIVSAITVVSTIKVRQGNSDFMDFTISTISKPAGFSAITTDNDRKTITYSIADNTTTLAEHGSITIPILIENNTYHLSFQWVKARAGNAGTPGTDANLLDWVNDWNTNKTLINSTTVITPRIFSGVNNPDGSLTGIALGRITLGVRNTLGNIVNETVDGIYGFKNSFKTFFVDNSGNVGLGRGEQSIMYNASTGKVEFGSGISLNWIGASYIDKNGIFTGVLSAATINTLHLNATQITSGTISVDRIDVNSLKSSLITAGNIEALTLRVTRGTIGGWSIDSDSIYRGSKNNTLGTYTGSSGNITIGSNGLRGYKWQLDATGAGTIAGGNISWDAAGKVTFSSAVALQWNTPINSITSALGGSGFNKMTKITAEGIYTGSITASQITAGTISADRIATGSIHATKLDASSIRTSIINTDYINGLSCTFSRGKIGGWTIGTNALTNTNISLDNGNRRIVVYGSGSGPTIGKRVQLYYNSDADFGLYSTDANGQGIFRLGSNNQIAGWEVNSSQIYKNNVYLGADGSITNSTKWKLNNDGSGQIAGGNISWNTAGTVTFAQSVSLNWKNDIEAAKSANYGYRYYKQIVIKGESNKYYPVILKGGEQTVKRDILIRRSYYEQAPADWDNNSSTHMGGLILYIKTNYGGWGGASYSWDIYELSECYSKMFAGAIHCGNYCMFAVFLRGGGATGATYHIYSDQPIENTLYSPSPIPPSPQIAYNSDLIFQVNDSKSYAPAPRTMTVTVENEIRRHRFIVLSQNLDTTLTQHPLTQINSTGIYTGTLTAVQVNAVNINASSVQSGTLSADRIGVNSLNGNKITARSITADRIITQVITANEIKTRSITADRIVSSAITANEIAARTITANQIKTSAITANEIAANTITATQIASRTITAAKIATGTITASEINVASVQASVVTAGAVNALSCDFKKGKVGGFELNDHALISINVTSGHALGIHNDGYMYNCNSVTSVDYWALNTDGSAMFGTGKIYFKSDGSGYLANQNIKWDVSGNVTIKGNITASSGKIAGFTISGNKLINTASDSSIEFSSMIGHASLSINTTTSLIDMRADSSRTGISIHTYATGAKGLYIVANTGSLYAIEAYGPMQFGQRPGEKWSMPGVLYIGCKYSTGYNNNYRKIWGDGITVTSFSHIGDGKYRVNHNLNHTEYTVMAILWSDTGYYGYFRLLEKTTTYFVIQNVNTVGKADAGAFDFIIMGRNVF